MNMISPQQIKAARAMLDMSQDEFAQVCGLSSNTIHSLEKGQKSYRSSMEIRKACEKKGVQFWGDTGVSLQKEKTIKFDGADSRDLFFQYMLSAAKENGDDIVAIFRTPELLVNSFGPADDAKQDRLAQLRKYANIRCVISDSGQSTPNIKNVEFRAVSDEFFSTFSTMACGNKYAMILSCNGIDFYYYIVESIEIAQSEAVRFEKFWNKGWGLSSTKY